MTTPPGRPKSLPPRLLALAQHIRPTAAVIDVGTDHAFLPIYLAQQGHVGRLIAMDIAPGPLAQAEGNIARRRLSDRIELALSNGLEQLQSLNIDPDTPLDIVIAGMGGENIAAILAEFMGAQFNDVSLHSAQSPSSKSSMSEVNSSDELFSPVRCRSSLGCRYLLQPMTRAEKLLDFLADVNLHAEEYTVSEGRRVYQYFVAMSK